VQEEGKREGKSRRVRAMGGGNREGEELRGVEKGT